jgi:hypothetical protein
MFAAGCAFYFHLFIRYFQGKINRAATFFQLGGKRLAIVPAGVTPITISSFKMQDMGLIPTSPFAKSRPQSGREAA